MLIENVYGVQRPSVLHQRLGFNPRITFQGAGVQTPPGQPNLRMRGGMAFGVNGLAAMNAPYNMAGLGDMTIGGVTLTTNELIMLAVAAWLLLRR